MFIELPDTATAGFRLPLDPMLEEEDGSTVTVQFGFHGGRGALVRAGRPTVRGTACTQVLAGDDTAATFTTDAPPR